MIYFIQIEPGGPIKVGYTCERTAKDRLNNLQASCPWKLVLRGVIEGDLTEEQRILSHLLAHRMRGEWFAPHPFVVDMVNQLLGDASCVVAGSAAVPTAAISPTPHFPDDDLNAMIDHLSKHYRLPATEIATEAVRDGLMGLIDKLGKRSPCSWS